LHSLYLNLYFQKVKMNIGIIGLGLIGGSLALDLKANGFAEKIFGVDSNPQNQVKAKELNLVDAVLDLDAAVKKSDLIILAIPVKAIAELLPKVLDKISSDQTVTDMGSTKFEILEKVKGHKNRGRFVASHPMAGTEKSGPAAALNNLFANKVAIICDRNASDEEAIKLIIRMYKSLFMRPIFMDGNAHDVHAAYISHVSHISSFILANTVLQKEKDEAKIFELASGGFESTVRLAKSSPQMWADIFEQNSKNISEVLETYLELLQKFKAAVDAKDYNYMHNQMEKANAIKRILP